MMLMAERRNTSRADPLVFSAAFAAMFSTRLWGMRRLMRKEIHCRTAFALRIFRIPVGVACLWWLLTRRTLAFEVTEKGRRRQAPARPDPRIIWLVAGIVFANAAYAAAGLAGLVPWQSDPSSTAASGAWLLFAAFVLLTGVLRIRHADYATSRRNAHRVRSARRSRSTGSRRAGRHLHRRRCRPGAERFGSELRAGRAEASSSTGNEGTHRAAARAFPRLVDPRVHLRPGHGRRLGIASDVVDVDLPHARRRGPWPAQRNARRRRLLRQAPRSDIQGALAPADVGPWCTDHMTMRAAAPRSRPPGRRRCGC